MRSAKLSICCLLAAGMIPAADDNPVVFRSDVSLVRVDAQVVDRNNRTITGLRADDFVLREEGRPQQIRNFASEEMPLDVLLLLDVSSSMRPHVQRIASAAHQALRVLRADDRVGIMVFDRSTRVRLSFRSSREDVEREFDSLLRQETFNGGTDITRGLLDAAEYVQSHARPEVRRAIVILTDDETERDRDEEAVERSLTRANAVLSALIAPDAMRNRGGMGQPGGGGWPGGGGGSRRRGGISLPGSGGPWGGSPWPGGGGRGPVGGGGPGMGGSRTHSAGTSEIARSSGGDSVPVSDASALETTLSRLRQRYALHFYLPRDVKAGQERAVEVQLASGALQRYPGAEVRYRRGYLAPSGADQGTAGQDATVVTRAGSTVDSRVADAPSGTRRRRAVNSPASDGPTVDTTGSDGAWRRSEDPAPAPQAAPAPAPTPAADEQANPGGWRKLKPGEQP
jgi:VWFA-related protein